MSSKVDLSQLRQELKSLQRWQPLYKLLKEELTLKGYWQLHPRGNPQKAYKHGWGKNARRT